MTPARRGHASRRRRGHTLAELIAAVTLLGACLGTVSTLALAGAERTRRGMLVQEATRAAAELLDSLLLHPDPTAGDQRRGSVSVNWTPELSPDGAMRVVVSAEARGVDRVRLVAPWYPLPPVFPMPPPAAGGADR